MKFSLIICTYMRPDSLLKLLNSVTNQTLYPNEILIIDGSTNFGTQQILEIHNFNNLKYYKVEEKDRGLTKQRNFGISKVSDGIDIICFLDDDTLLKKAYFKELIGTYNIYPFALAVGGYITNDVKWITSKTNPTITEFYYDGWSRKEGARFTLRKKLGLIDNTTPGFMPKFSHGRSISFLPPSGKIYEVEQIMGGVSSYRKELFKTISFSTYFEGYGLYEDADFSLRIAKKGKLYINTNAKLEHHHDESGRPNRFNYGKMVLRNGWYVWRLKYPTPSLKATFKWHSISLLLTIIRFSNIFNTSKRREAFTESVGRIVGWWSLLFNKPKVSE